MNHHSCHTYRVTFPAGDSRTFDTLDHALTAGARHIHITTEDKIRAQLAFSMGSQRHIIVYGFAETWIEQTIREVPGVGLVDTADVAREAIQILDGKHPHWDGEPSLDARAFMMQVGCSAHGGAFIAQELREHSDDWTEALSVDYGVIDSLATWAQLGVNAIKMGLVVAASH